MLWRSLSVLECPDNMFQDMATPHLLRLQCVICRLNFQFAILGNTQTKTITGLSVSGHKLGFLCPRSAHPIPLAIPVFHKIKHRYFCSAPIFVIV
mmetsp:Transcript_36043/g.76866  ORF Transcript_36043/g.76866 Transcript_36043/m.76866 type:complete len:95 (+) Transcript_36043:24-308(+)